MNSGAAAPSPEEVAAQLTPLTDGQHEIARAISDEQNLAALNMLRRMIANVDGAASHPTG
ncbi:hypothetical protein ACFYWO_09865 [Streptomyces sp. NPDC002932]|uniref:hypothetical protein n=1 Tax=Streptomyces sp. NPDC002932 TaxID=3364672 RepID=UPI0036CC8264